MGTAQEKGVRACSGQSSVLGVCGHGILADIAGRHCGNGQVSESYDVRFHERSRIRRMRLGQFSAEFGCHTRRLVDNCISYICHLKGCVLRRIRLPHAPFRLLMFPSLSKSNAFIHSFNHVAVRRNHFAFRERCGYSCIARTRASCYVGPCCVRCGDFESTSRRS